MEKYWETAPHAVVDSCQATAFDNPRAVDEALASSRSVFPRWSLVSLTDEGYWPVE